MVYRPNICEKIESKISQYDDESYALLSKKNIYDFQIKILQLMKDTCDAESISHEMQIILIQNLMNELIDSEE